MRSLYPVALSALLAVASTPAPAPAQDARDATDAIVKNYLNAHPDEIGEIVKSYFIRHPDAVVQIMAEILKQHRASRAGVASAAPKVGVDRAAAIAAAGEALFASPHQATVGARDGDVTLVEFFDYNCGFCKRALADTIALAESDPHLKIVLKDLPILGPGSTAAARVAIAARMQEPNGARYLAFHEDLLGSPGPASEQKALAAARAHGFDMDRIARDAASDEVSATIDENVKLAGALGFSGTPSYVVGKEAFVGAVGLVALKDRIAKARADVTVAAPPANP